MNIEAAREIAAQAWCRSTAVHKQMDPDLAESFAEILCAAIAEAQEALLNSIREQRSRGTSTSDWTDGYNAGLDWAMKVIRTRQP